MAKSANVGTLPKGGPELARNTESTTVVDVQWCLSQTDRQRGQCLVQKCSELSCVDMT